MTMDKEEKAGDLGLIIPLTSKLIYNKITLNYTRFYSVLKRKKSNWHHFIDYYLSFERPL